MDISAIAAPALRTPRWGPFFVAYETAFDTALASVQSQCNLGELG